MSSRASIWYTNSQGVAPVSTLTVISRVVNGVPRVNPIVSQVTGVTANNRLSTRVSRLR
jgi:hypothetical protein